MANATNTTDTVVDNDDDTLIAGTVLAHGAILVTRNTREFGRVKRLRLENWY